MGDRFLYVYFMRDRPDQMDQVVPQHVAYWRGLDLPGYLGGPFADRSGGSISFEADDGADAEHMVAGDPFVAADLIRESWLKEWRIE